MSNFFTNKLGSEHTQPQRQPRQTGRDQRDRLVQSIRATPAVPADPVVRDSHGRPVGRVLSARVDQDGLSVQVRLEDPAILAFLADRALREGQEPHAVLTARAPLAAQESPSRE